MRSAIVTGAASGIGRAIAVRLAHDGWAVVGVDRDRAGLDALSAEVRAAGSTGAAIVGDVADRDTHRRAGDVAREHGPLGVWVGAAGLTRTHALTDLDEAAARHLIEVNQLGMLWGSAEAVAEWVRTGTPGTVAVISSVHGQRAYPNHTVYEMTKAAAEALVRSVAVTYGPHGIRAVGIAPGAVTTPALLAALGSAADGPAAQQHLEQQTPSGRLASPDEIAAVVSFLVSEEASYVSGVTVHVDGGWSAVLAREPRDATALRPVPEVGA